jgi:hypothetical protein
MKKPREGKMLWSFNIDEIESQEMDTPMMEEFRSEY